MILMAKTIERKRLIIVLFILTAFIATFFVITDNASAAAKKTLKAKNVTLSATKLNPKFKTIYKDCDDTEFKMQRPKVTVKYNGKTLKQGKDYTLTARPKEQNVYDSEYADYVGSPGVYYVKVTGKGKYKGTVYKRYIIKRINLSTKTCKLTYFGKDYTYTGKKIAAKPSDFVLDYNIPNSKLIFNIPCYGEYQSFVKASSYTCSKADWSKTGKATIKIKTEPVASSKLGCCNPFCGSTTLTGSYVIYPTKPKVTSCTVNGSSVTVKWTKPKGDFTKYRLYFINEKNYDTKHSYYVTIKNTETQYTKKNLPAGKYSVYIVPVKSGFNYVSDGYILWGLVNEGLHSNKVFATVK